MHITPFPMGSAQPARRTNQRTVALASQSSAQSDGFHRSSAASNHKATVQFSGWLPQFLTGAPAEIQPDIELGHPRADQAGPSGSAEAGAGYSMKSAQAALPVKNKVAAQKVAPRKVQDPALPPILQAAQQGNLYRIKGLMSEPDFDINQVAGPNHSTALHLSAEAGHEKVVAALLEHPEIAVNQMDSYGRTALMLAAYGGHSGIVEKLMAHRDCDPTLVSAGGSNALKAAALKSDENTLMKLLAGPVDVNHVGGILQSTALHTAVSQNKPQGVSLILRHPDVDPNKVDGRGYSPTLEAAAMGHVEALNHLLKHPKTKVDQVVPATGDTLVHAALSDYAPKIPSGLREVTLQRVLADKRVNPNMANLKQRTPLMEAAYKGMDDSVAILLDHPQLDVHATNLAGESALDLAKKELAKGNPWQAQFQRIVRLLEAKVAQKPKAATLSTITPLPHEPMAIEMGLRLPNGVVVIPIPE